MASDPIESEIEGVLGRQLHPSESGSLHHLNTITPAALADARRLDPILGLAYLRYLADEATRPYLTRFLEDVVVGGADPATWGRGGLLVPTFAIEELLSQPVAEILAPLQRDEERWLHLSLDEDAWKEGDYFPGAPVIERPSLEYTSHVPSNVLRLLRHETLTFELVDDVVIATRRWIASRAAAVARALNVALERQDPESLSTTIAPSLRSLSDDAYIALRALILEQQAGLSSGVPGFVGPTKWYENK